MRRCRGSFSGGKRRHGGAMRRAVTIRIGRLGDVCDIVTTHHPGSARSSHRSPPRGSRCRRGWPWCPRVSRGITKRDEPLPTVAKSIGAAETGPVAPSRGESRERGTPRRGCELLYVEYRDGAPRYLIPAPTPRTRLCGGRAPCGGGNISRDIKFLLRALRYLRRFFWQELAWVKSTTVRVYDG